MLIPYLPALDFFLGLIAALPQPVRSFFIWALGLAGVWAVLHVLLENT